jgi:hypothetical protein
LLAAVAALVLFGAATLYSASYSAEVASLWTLESPVTRQMLFGSLGFVLLILAARVDYHTFSAWSPAIYLAILFVLGAVLVYGQTVYGAQRWLDSPLMPLQPSELAKLGTIVVLARYFAHTDETDAQLAVLADVAVGLMYGGIKPLGGLVTRLPIGPEHAGAVVGPSFELFYDVDYLLPHREAAWLVIEERLRDVAELALHCRDHCVVTFMAPLAKVTDQLLAQADRLAAAR